MPKICYVERKFSKGSQALIEQANEILREYDQQGYVLTLRQLYYQFVARDIIPNNQREYKRLGSVINDARLAGLIDWNFLEDRTRNLQSLSAWDKPQDILESATAGYHINRWATQPNYVEVWIEKDALAGVFDRVCNSLDIPYFSCRGYTSQSELWRAGRRLARKSGEHEGVYVLHFGDHDPSGVDMTRDIQDRLSLFGADAEVRRLALNVDQIEQYEPPPNPAKITDSRADKYIALFGSESWELDALEPSVLSDLVTNEVDGLIDRDAWEEVVERERQEKIQLAWVRDNWERIQKG